MGLCCLSLSRLTSDFVSSSLHEVVELRHVDRRKGVCSQRIRSVAICWVVDVPYFLGVRKMAQR